MIYRAYTNNGGVPGTQGGGVNQQAYPSTTLMGAFASRLPYAYQIVDAMVKNNPKFYKFKNETSLRDDMLQDQSVLLAQNPNQDNYGVGTPGGFAVNKDYQAFVYATLDKDKNRRLQDYRRMAAYAELADALDEICDEALVYDEDGKCIDVKLRGDYSKTIQDTIVTEFRSFVEIFDLENKGWEYFRNLLIDGEMFFENIIKEGREELGIIGLISIPPELINPIYHNVQNELLKGFLLQKPIIGPTQSINTEDQNELMFLQKAQVSYINSGMWNEFKTIRLPFIENAKRAYRMLSLIEDSVVIYRLVRAPERLVFKVFTGNMPPPKAEAFLKGMMMKFWSKKTFNSANSQVANVYDPQSMLDAYWFPVDQQGKGTEVSTLPSGGALGEIKDLDYFLKKLYVSLKVPVSRFQNPGDPFKDGTEIARDELRFARFIIRLQQQVANAIKNTFITHLKLRGLWHEYKMKESAIKIRFNEPSSFMAMRNQELLALKFTNYNTATQSEAMSKSYAQKYYLNMTAEHMEENRQWLRKDAALEWELGQIKSNGPNFREQVALQQGGAAAPEAGGGEAGGGLIGGGGGGGGGAEIPEFGGGAAPAGGETGAAPEAGAAATPEAGGAAAPEAGAGEAAPAMPPV
jgi:Bacteriophage T4-like portal protein (Gp20)